MGDATEEQLKKKNEKQEADEVNSLLSKQSKLVSEMIKRIEKLEDDKYMLKIKKRKIEKPKNRKRGKSERGKIERRGLLDLGPSLATEETTIVAHSMSQSRSVDGNCNGNNNGEEWSSAVVGRSLQAAPRRTVSGRRGELRPREEERDGRENRSGRFGFFFSGLEEHR
ncbi:hypothetical protein ACLOJK_030195 [Asimina triloba]